MSILEFAQAGTHPRYFREIEMPILLYLLPDDELPERLRKERPGSAPMTVPLITERQTVDFSQDMQEFVYSLNYGMPRARFDNLMDTWWNTGNRVRDCRNYITGERLTADYPKYPLNLTLGGNTYKAVGDVFPWGGGYGLEIGTPVYRLESINVYNIPEIIPPFTRTYLTIYNNGRVFQFPQRDGDDCFTALFSVTPLFIEAERVRVVEFAPSPYKRTQDV